MATTDLTTNTPTGYQAGGRVNGLNCGSHHSRTEAFPVMDVSANLVDPAPEPNAARASAIEGTGTEPGFGVATLGEKASVRRPPDEPWFIQWRPQCRA